MGRLNLAGPLGLSIAAALPQPGFADVGVPSAARMVHQATLIVVGQVAPTQPPSLVIGRILKGSAGGHPALTLVDPTGGQFLNFNLGRVPEIVGAAPTIALGQVNAARASLSLTWLNASLWPQGPRPDTFDSATLESTAAFIERLLSYSAVAAKDPDAAVRMLVGDIAANRSPAALAYLELAVQTDFGAPAAAQIRAVCAVALSRGSPDAASVRQFADTVPVYPASLAAPLAIALADRAGADAKRLRAALQALLKARGAALDRAADSAQLRQAFGSLAPTLRRADAKRMLAVFDSALATLRDTYADALLAELTGLRPQQNLAGLPALQRKAIWQREIDTMPD